MAATRRLATARTVLFALTLAFAGRAEALTVGSGTVNLTVNAIAKTLGVSATFTDANLGSVGTVSATSVALHNVELGTGVSFVVPFANVSNSFDAAGDIACPSGGCLAPLSGPYAFVGFLQNVSVSLLPAGYTYTFDGSVTCTGGLLAGLTCNGPFVLNAFPLDTVTTGPTVTIDRMG